MPKPEENVMRSEQNGSGVSNETTVSFRPRRKLSPSEKLRIVKTANACVERGEIGALLRKEGIYSSQLTQWRRQFNDAGEKGITGARRGPKQVHDARDRRIMELEKQVSHLEGQLGMAQKIMDLQKKVSALFGIECPQNVENS